MPRVLNCVKQKREEAEGTAASEEAAAVSEEAAAASDAPAAMDASEAESDSSTGRSGRSLSRGRSLRAVQKPEEEAPAKQPNSRSKKARRPLVSPRRDERSAPGKTNNFADPTASSVGGGLRRSP